MPARVLVVDDLLPNIRLLQARLTAEYYEVLTAQSGAEALAICARGGCDLVLLDVMMPGMDGFETCARIKAAPESAHIPVVMVTALDQPSDRVRGLEAGADDFLTKPVDELALMARVRTQIRRKFYADALRENVRASIELAMLDGLTGLFNRRHFDLNLPKLIESCLSRRRPLSLLVFDIDHFKAINDTHGHDVGDQVLRLLAQRLRGALRQSDLICRLGGEEFAVIMPDTDLDRAASVGNRVRLAIAEYPFAVGQGRGPIDVTISAGVAGAVEGLSPEMLYRRADAGLYRSKQAGRNRVCAAAA